MMTDKYPLTSFYLLALAFSALVLGIVVATGAGESLFILGTLGPAVAAVVVVGLRGDRAAAWRFVRSALNPRFGFRWWAVAVLLPLVMTVVALVATSARSGLELNSDLWASLAAAIPLIVMLTLLNGIPEEIGWRGFMLPVAQRSRSALKASLVVGFWWGVWHLPIFFIDGSFHATLWDELGFLTAFGFWTAASMVFSIGYTWLYNTVGGGALAAGVFHGAANGWIGAAIMDLSPAQTVEMFIWLTLGWLLVAVYFLQTNGGDTLTHSGRKIVDHTTSPADPVGEGHLLRRS